MAENPDINNQDYLKILDGINDFINSSSGNTMLDNNVPNMEKDESPQELLDRAYKTIFNALTDDLLNEVMKQSPDFFEN